MPKSFLDTHKDTLDLLLMYKESCLSLEYLETVLKEKEPFMCIRLSELLGYYFNFYSVLQFKMDTNSSCNDLLNWIKQLHSILINLMDSKHPERILSLQMVDEWISKALLFSSDEYLTNIDVIPSNPLLNTLKKYHEYISLVLSRLQSSFLYESLMDWISKNTLILLRCQ